MFTGLIESIGRVARRVEGSRSIVLDVETNLAPQLHLGDSVAVNGVCLTVTAHDERAFSATVSPETASVTTLGRIAPGTCVNLERPLRADGRVGGHFVQGHVDAPGEIVTIDADAECHRMTVAYPFELEPYVVRKGSIAIDGISLTVAGQRPEALDVQIVPYTFDHTNLREARAGDRVNLECDIIAKYVVKLARAGQVSRPEVT